MHLEKNEFLDKLIQLDPKEFEEFIGEIWEHKDWLTEVKSETRDKGIDIVAKKSDIVSQKALIQVKKYSRKNRINSEDVRYYATLKTQGNKVDLVVIITTSSFTNPAEEIANDLNVKLIDGHKLYKLVKSLYKPMELMKNYIDNKSLNNTSQKKKYNTRKKQTKGRQLNDLPHKQNNKSKSKKDKNEKKEEDNTNKQNPEKIGVNLELERKYRDKIPDNNNKTK